MASSRMIQRWDVQRWILWLASLLLLLRLLLLLHLVAFGDFVANVTAAHSAYDSGQLAAITATDLVADQTAYHST